MLGTIRPEDVRAALYTRDSTEDQDSTETQERAGREEIRRRCWSLRRVYRDHGFSAYQGRGDDRPEFQAMLADIRAGEVNAVIVYTLSRFARRIQLMNELLEEFQRRGVLFVSVLENIDLTTPYGWAGFQMSAVWAELQSRITAKLTQEKMHDMAALGYWVAGSVPFAYRMPYWFNEREERIPARIIEPTDDQVVAVALGRRYALGRIAFSGLADWANTRDWARIRDYARAELEGSDVSLLAWAHQQDWAAETWANFEADGLTQQVLIRDWRRRGVQPLREYSIRSILDNYPKSYSGLITFNDKVYKGKHPAIVTPALVEEVAEARRQRRKQPHIASSFQRSWAPLLCEIARCAQCGGRMWSNPHDGKRGGYVCGGRRSKTCTAKESTATYVEGQLLAYLGQLRWTPEQQAQVIKLAQESLKAEHEATRPQDEKPEEVREELRRLGIRYQLRLVDDAEFQQQYNRLNHRLGQLEHASGTAPSIDYKKAANLLSNALAAFELMTIEERREFVAELFDAVWLERREVVAVTPTKAFERLLTAARKVDLATPGRPGWFQSTALTPTRFSVSERHPQLWIAHRTPLSYPRAG